VKDGKIKSMEEIYLHSLPIKEYQIVDFFLPKLKDEVMKVCKFWQRGNGQTLGSERLTILSTTDQARPKANSCWSTNSIQGHRCYW
jgi:hypothetical protein